MRLASVHKDVSPDNVGFIRVTGIAEKESGERIEIWFEVPSEYETALSDTGNPWVVAMLPYALENGETIVSDIPVDAELLENLKGLTAVWCNWYSQFKQPKIIAPIAPLPTIEVSVRRTATFFSGGVDSWFTVLRHAPELESAAIGRIDDLISVQGFDIPVESMDEFAKLQSVLAVAAKELGRDLIVVRTNLRKINTLWAKGWGWLTHAAGLAVVGLIMEKRYGKALIGSSYPYGGLFPWGSHPLTDGLFSTQSLQFKHDGAAFSRVEKTELVARHKLALSNLHVCWISGSASNCGKCFKCIRTMATLHMLGALQNHNPFPVDFQLDGLAGLYIENSDQEDFIRELHDLAVRTAHFDIQLASLRVLKRSRRLRPLVKFADWLSGVPYIWRFGPRLRKRLVG